MPVTQTRAAALLLPVLLAGCGGAAASNLSHAVVDSLPGGIPRVSSAGPTAWTDSTGAELVEQGRFSGEDGSPAELAEPRSIAVDEAGRVYVVDNKPAAIKVFSPDGQFIRSIGREGEGPGEFRVGFIAVRGGHLVLHDPRLSRTSVWDTAGSFIRSWHSSCCYWSDIQIDRDGRVYVPSMVPTKPGEKRRGTAYVRWSVEGTALDTMWLPEREGQKLWTIKVNKGGKNQGMMMTTIPFMPTMTHALHPDGGAVYAWTAEYSIVRSARGTDSVRVFGRTWTADPITDERRRGEVESRIKAATGSWGEANTRAAFRLDDVPSTLPAFMNLMVDGAGRIWARRFPVSDTTRTWYDVFDSTGAYLGPVTVGLKVTEWGPQAWTREGLVTVIEDADGRPTVVRLKLANRR